jgi:hypothetical protein
MADFGIKIGKAGADVSKAADKDLVYSTKYNGMKIAMHNTKAAAGSVSHNLGYVPVFLNYMESGGCYRLQAQITPTLVPASYATANTLVLGGTNNHYFIFIDRG